MKTVFQFKQNKCWTAAQKSASAIKEIQSKSTNIYHTEQLNCVLYLIGIISFTSVVLMGFFALLLSFSLVGHIQLRIIILHFHGPKLYNFFVHLLWNDVLSISAMNKYWFVQWSLVAEHFSTLNFCNETSFLVCYSLTHKVNFG